MSTFCLSAVVGSFFAGVAVAQTPYKQEIDSSIEPIGYAVFIPMFFVSIGLNMTFKGLLTNWLFIVILLVLALLTKWGGCGLGAKMCLITYLSNNQRHLSTGNHPCSDNIARMPTHS